MQVHTCNSSLGEAWCQSSRRGYAIQYSELQSWYITEYMQLLAVFFLIRNSLQFMFVQHSP